VLDLGVNVFLDVNHGLKTLKTIVMEDFYKWLAIGENIFFIVLLFICAYKAWVWRKHFKTKWNNTDQMEDW
jgi:hypothetical protein